MNPNEQPQQQVPPVEPQVQPPAQPITPAPVQQQYQAPQAPMQPAANEDPGKTLGLVGLILAIFIAPAGFVVSLIALIKSKKAHFSNPLAIIGIVISVIIMIIQLIVIVGMIAAVATVVQKCNELGPGTHYENGVTYECN